MRKANRQEAGSEKRKAESGKDEGWHLVEPRCTTAVLNANGFCLCFCFSFCLCLRFFSTFASAFLEINFFKTQ